MFVSVHAKEFNASPLFAEGNVLISAPDQREKAMALLDACQRGEVRYREEDVVGFRRKMSEGVFYCCRSISHIVDTAGRRLPFLFCMREGEEPRDFERPLKILGECGYCFSPEEFAAVCRGFERLKKKGFLDRLCGFLAKVFGFFGKIWQSLRGR